MPSSRAALRLAQTLGSVSEACKVLGFSRGRLYRVRELARMPSIRFVVALCLALLAPLAFGQAARPSPPHRVGLLVPASVNSPNNLDGFFRQLREYGYVEGQNLVLEWRFADGHEDRLAPLAAELAQQKVDVIVAFGPSASCAAARQATSTMPVVISTIGGPRWWL